MLTPTAPDPSWTQYLIHISLRSSALSPADAVQGILGVAWSQNDPTMLVSTGHDRRTLLWDVPSGEVRGELHLQPGPGFSVKWAPAHAGLFATAAMGKDDGDQGGQVLASL